MEIFPGGLSEKIEGERTAVHVINTDSEDFGSCSACNFLAPFSSVLHTPELGHPLKSNNPGNGQDIFLRGLFTPYKSSI